MGDIDHNRAGRLSPAQAEVLRKTQRRNVLVYLGIPMIGVQLGGGLVAYAFGAAPGIVIAILAALAGLAIFAGTVFAAYLVWQRAGALAHETVTWVDGRVVWAGGTWTPTRPSGVPFVIKAGAPLLPPGPYRFYLHDDQIVGAESPLDHQTYWSLTQYAPGLFTLGAASSLPPAPIPVGEPETFQSILAQVVGFTAEDLTHHRRGTLSPRQGAGRVLAIDGLISVGYTMHTRVSITYWWDIGGRRIEVPLAWLYAVPAGVAYRCYLDERTNRLVSLEPLGRQS